jgi:4'-phosphopantetheinyl transferase
MNPFVATRHFHWSLPPGECRISENEVHVWVADLDEELRLGDLFKTLSADEQERAGRFHFKPDKKRFVAARGLLRAILSCYTNIPADALKFEYEANGKPRLPNANEFQHLEFNLSHSGGLALYAVALNRRLGVDLEWINFFSDMDEVANRCFSPQENFTLRFLDSREKEENFFRYWTRKEAKLKCSGEGFSSAADNEIPFHGILLELNPAENYVGSLAVEGKPFTLQTWQWPRS